MQGRVHLGLEEPTAEAIAALDLEVYVAPLDHHVLRGDDLSTGGVKAGPGDIGCQYRRKYSPHSVSGSTRQSSTSSLGT